MVVEPVGFGDGGAYSRAREPAGTGDRGAYTAGVVKFDLLAKTWLRCRRGALLSVLYTKRTHTYGGSWEASRAIKCMPYVSLDRLEWSRACEPVTLHTGLILTHVSPSRWSQVPHLGCMMGAAWVAEAWACQVRVKGTRSAGCFCGAQSTQNMIEMYDGGRHGSPVYSGHDWDV
eukprot:scaffold7018_cov18-Tisochrysis_lutea.AAC.4